MKRIKNVISILLVVLLILTLVPNSVFAAENNTPKEEVVYINLNADGSVKEINVVNIFDLDKDGRIIDYGQYENLRNMTTTDNIDYKNNTVTIDTNADKLYYEGKLKENVMPWTITIKYFIDGKEYPSNQIAGMSGKLEIKISIKQNKDCDSSFFEGYALQASLTLDTNKATDIQANSATIANVGSDKQLTYTILPNKEKEIVVSANVKDFEMNGIAINGIRINLDIDFDDSTLQKKIDEVIGAVNDLDEGADKLHEGSTDLYDATGKLNTAMGELYTGVGSLNSGASELSNGLATLATKNKELTDGAWSAYEGLCSVAETQLNTQLVANGFEKVTLTPSTYSNVLLGLLEKMGADTAYRTTYNIALSKVTKEVEAQADTLYEAYIQSQADAIYLTYIHSQADTLYVQVATKAVMHQLMENGMSEEVAIAYLQTEEGKILIKSAVNSMSEEQKEQIITMAVASLTDKQKQQILQEALASLTEKQKSEITNTYIEKMMASEEIQKQINEAVRQVSEAAAQVSALKGQLDKYGVFYRGLVEYTNAVSSAAGGASTLSNGINTLYSNTETLKTAVGKLYIAVGTLNEGTNELKSGTGEFVSETDGMDTQVSTEIEGITASMTGKNVETISFVSKQNTNIKSVQFVIQTDGIEIAPSEKTESSEPEKLSFWQKFLKLFGWD